MSDLLAQQDWPQLTSEQQQKLFEERQFDEYKLLTLQYEALGEQLSPDSLARVMNSIKLPEWWTLLDQARVDFMWLISAEWYRKATWKLPISREKKEHASWSESKEFKENPRLLAKLKVSPSWQTTILTPDWHKKEVRSSDLEHRTDVLTEKVENKIWQISLIKEVAVMYSEYLGSVKSAIVLWWTTDKPKRYQNQIDTIHRTLAKIEAQSSTQESMMRMDIKSLVDTMFVAEADIWWWIDHIAVRGVIRKGYWHIKEILLWNDTVKFDEKWLKKKRWEIYSILRIDDKLDDDDRKYNGWEPTRKALEGDILTNDWLRQNKEVKTAFDSLKALTEHQPEVMAELSSLSEKWDKPKLVSFLKKHIPWLKDKSYNAIASDCMESWKEAVKYRNQPNLRETLKRKLTEEIRILIDNAPNPEKKQQFQNLLESSELKDRIEFTINTTSQTLVSEALRRGVIKNCLSEHKDVVSANTTNPEVDLYTNIEGLQGVMNISDKSYNSSAEVIQEWVIPIALMWWVWEVLTASKALIGASRLAIWAEKWIRVLGVWNKAMKGLTYGWKAIHDGIIWYETFTAWTNLVSAQDAMELNRWMDSIHENLKSIVFMWFVAWTTAFLKKFKVYEKFWKFKEKQAILKHIPIDAIVTIPVHTTVLTWVSLTIRYTMDSESLRKDDKFTEVMYKEAVHISKLVTWLCLAWYLHNSSIEKPLIVEAKHSSSWELVMGIIEESQSQPKKAPQSQTESANPLLLPESKYADMPRKKLLEHRKRVNTYIRKHPNSSLIGDYMERIKMIDKALELKPTPKPILPKSKKEPHIEPKVIEEPIQQAEEASPLNDPLEKTITPPSDRVEINELIKSTLQETLSGFSQNPTTLSEQFRAFKEQVGTAQWKDTLLREFDTAMEQEVSNYLNKVLKDNPALAWSEGQKIKEFKIRMRRDFEKAITEWVKLKKLKPNEQNDPKNRLNQKNEWSRNQEVFKKMIMEYAKDINESTADEIIWIRQEEEREYDN